MPGTSKAKNPKGYEIEFFEDSHYYKTIIDGREVKYTSGTAFSHPFFPEFDPDGKITERCAKKEGISVEELKERWAAKGRESCRLGTRTHETIEDILHGNQLRNISENEDEQKRFNNAINIAKALKSKIDILGIELIVFDVELALAGTIDLFGLSKKDGTYYVIDHKTNADLLLENKYKSFAFEPISNVPNTAFGHYLIQLNLYLYLLKYGGYVPKDAKFKMFLNHVTSDQAKLIEVPDRQNEIKDMMILYLLKYRKT